jgi:tetratricopeptide (TPR) repeat protein
MTDTNPAFDPERDDEPPRPGPSVIDNTRWALAGGIAIAGVALAIGLASGPSRPPTTTTSGLYPGATAGEAEARRELKDAREAAERDRVTAHQALAELADSADDVPPPQLLPFCEELVSYPVPERGFEHACGLMIRARIWLGRGDRSRAEADYVEALSLLGGRYSGVNADTRDRVLARAWVDVAALLRETAKPEEVRQMHDQAIEVARGLVGRQPGWPSAQRALARALEAAAAAAVRAGRLADAEKLLQEAASVQGKRRDRRAVARAHITLGQVYCSASRSRRSRRIRRPPG